MYSSTLYNNEDLMGITKHALSSFIPFIFTDTDQVYYVNVFKEYYYAENDPMFEGNRHVYPENVDIDEIISHTTLDNNSSGQER